MVLNKIKEKITNFKKNIILNFVQLEDWFEIRSDFLQIYKNGINSGKIKKRIKNRNSLYWYSSAIKIKDISKIHHPFEKELVLCDDIFKGLVSFKDLYSRFQDFLSVLLIVSLIFGYGLWEVSLSNPLLSYILAAIITIILLLKLLLILFISIIKTEREIIEKTNEKLMLTKIELMPNKSKLDEMIVGYIWNRSLFDYNTIPIIGIFIIFKHINKSFYKSVVYGLLKYIPEYLDNGRKMKSLIAIAPDILKYYRTNRKLSQKTN